jgi:hypothetical protein
MRQTKYCQLCQQNNITKKLNEPHILFECQSLAEPRSDLQIMKNIHSRQQEQRYKAYWKNAAHNCNKIEAAKMMRDIYILAVKPPDQQNQEQEPTI